MRTLLFTTVVLTSACTQRTVDDTLPAFSKAYNSAFERLGSVGLADSGVRVQRLAAAGSAFAPQLEELRRRQHEVNDSIVKAVELKKQALLDKKPEVIDQATAILAEADAKAVKLHADIVSFNDKLTAAGAPVIPPEPARDPNARD